MQDTRDITLLVWGNNTDELEAKALKHAQKIFSGGVPLVVDRSYSIRKNTPTDAVPPPIGTTINAYIMIQVASGVINPAFPPEPSYFEKWYRRWVK